jgi:hypothetical protein
MQLSQLRRSFNQCIESAEAIWGDWAFKRPGRNQALAGMFDAQMVALAELRESEHAKLIRRNEEVKSAIDELFKDPRFEEAVRLGTNAPSRLRYRTSLVMESLARFTR